MGRTEVRKDRLLGLRNEVAARTQVHFTQPSPVQATPRVEQWAKFFTACSPFLLALVGVLGPYLKSWQDNRSAETKLSNVKAIETAILGSGGLDRLNGLERNAHVGLPSKELDIGTEHAVNYAVNEKTLVKISKSPAIIDTLGRKKLTIFLPDDQNSVIVLAAPNK